ncbi:MAG: Hsp70 family protein, partial [Simkania negevensis]|nr:Hsp70 family protein [Simkania negevensis]
RNKGESLVFQAEKSLKDYKDKIPESIAQEIQDKIDKVKKAIQSGSASAINTATEELSTHLQKIGQHMQQGASKTQETAANVSSSQFKKEKEKKAGIEEAEVEILDEEEEKK